MGVVTAKNAAGDVAIGIEEDGAFIPIATVPAHRIEHAKERQAILNERAEANDEEAQKALEEGFKVEGASAPEPEPEFEPQPGQEAGY
jgi:hypothetical protein